ncbi:hypothetical protein WMF30_10750 [Sorangium sp. So ce134]
MTDAQRIEATEAALRSACTEARAQGLVLVRESPGVTAAGVFVGCCAWTALGLTADEDAELPEVSAPEYDAIEHGWDGERAIAERDGLPMAWFDLGARLAAEFGPVPASVLEAG